VFDETFFFYGDDIEFGYRLGRAGIALVDAPSATVIHEGSKGSVNGSLFYEYHMARAHLLLVRKLGHGIVMQVMMVMARVLALAARATLRVARYRSLRAWRGLGMAMWDVTNGQVRTLTPAAEQT
jgi:GT2 family glycosyltransferase